jgi:hypothetical protein
MYYWVWTLYKAEDELLLSGSTAQAIFSVVFGDKQCAEMCSTFAVSWYG